MFRSRYRRRSWKFLALAIVAGAVVFLTAGGAVALFFLGWMLFPSSTSPGKAGATTVVVAPSKSARLASPAGEVLLEFPAGSVDRQTTVSYRRMSTATVTGLPPDFTLTDKVFDLSVAATEARDDTEFRFLQPVTVTVFLTGEDSNCLPRLPFQRRHTTLRPEHHGMGSYTDDHRPRRPNGPSPNTDPKQSCADRKEACFFS